MLDRFHSILHSLPMGDIKNRSRITETGSFRLIWFVFFYTFGGLFLASVEPFGLDSLVGNKSQEVAYRIFAPIYGGGSTDTSQFEEKRPPSESMMCP